MAPDVPWLRVLRHNHKMSGPLRAHPDPFPSAGRTTPSPSHTRSTSSCFWAAAGTPQASVILGALTAGAAPSLEGGRSSLAAGPRHPGVEAHLPPGCWTPAGQLGALCHAPDWVHGPRRTGGRAGARAAKPRETLAAPRAPRGEEVGARRSRESSREEGRGPRGAGSGGGEAAAEQREGGGCAPGSGRAALSSASQGVAEAGRLSLPPPVPAVGTPGPSKLRRGRAGAAFRCPPALLPALFSPGRRRRRRRRRRPEA
ncbi:MOB kinase activator 1B isoform X2 [Vulpes lagopus]|uniref:MOB kinase activator 1B isoform X2 n=1 Tax=Vulpes lagopus TaxID=494514 RepID=UPI001BC957B7|nr:MOB kinase activator 1B isoform X2 [Vulpes lagopus]